MRLFHLLWLFILLLNSDSSLQQNEITCDRKNIPEADVISRNKQTYRYNEQVRYRCKEGYQGQFTLTCRGEGWIGRSTCTEITCDRKNIREADVISENKQRYRYDEQVQYHCKEGYQGQFTLTCRGEGWIGRSTCTEITCDRKNIPEADVISENKQTYRYDEQVQYRCKDGDQGQFTLTCRGDGWIGRSTCTEITCDRKNIPEADVISENKQTYRYNEQVRYRCKEGYQGQFTLTCRGEGWIGRSTCTEITCDRKNIREADVISENKQRYRYDEQVQYHCKEGYQGQFTLTCRGEGWIGRSTCTEITCDRKNIPEADVISENKQTYRYDEQVQYRCKDGDQGQFTLTCRGDGWIGRSTCTEITCDRKNIPEADVISRNKQTYRYNEQVRYRCKEGYQGQFTLTCRGEGWIGRSTCTEITCNRKNIREADVISENKQRYRYNEQVQYHCKEGYQGQFTLTCRGEGWIGRSTCTEITCDRKNIPEADVISENKQTYRYDEQVQYRCKDGDQGQFTLTCRGDGWIGRSTCTEITCDRKNIPEADVISENKQRYRYNEQVRYRCKDGDQGQFTLTCRGEGWIGRSTCTEITCDRKNIQEADVISENKQRYRYDEQVQYRCKDGDQGQFTLTCRGEGWIGNPRCTEITCDRKNIPEADVISENKQRYRYNEQVQYRCKDGDQGQFTLTCRGEGWIGRSTCTAFLESVGCGSPPPLTDGDIKYTVKSNYSHQERVEFMCQRYYTMEGGPHRTCINGEWTGQMRCLKPCNVNEDVYRQHNITLKSSDSTYFTHDEIIEFRCARGVPVGVVAMRQRCNGGVILLPTCQ